MIYVTEQMPDLSLWVFSLDPHVGIQFTEASGWYLHDESLERFTDLSDEIERAADKLEAETAQEERKLEAVK